MERVRSNLGGPTNLQGKNFRTYYVHTMESMGSGIMYAKKNKLRSTYIRGGGKAYTRLGIGEEVEYRSRETGGSSYPSGRIKDMPLNTQPREILMRLGVEKCTTPELLAIVIRSGNTKENVLQLAQRLYLAYPLHAKRNSSITWKTGL